MDKQAFKKFIDDNKIESHWRNYIISLSDIRVMIPTALIREFQKIMNINSMNDEFLNCDMAGDYFAIDIYSWLLNNEFEDEEIKSIFPNLDNNV